VRPGRAVVAGLAGALAAAVWLAVAPPDAGAAPRVETRGDVRVWTVHYRAHTGARRAAYVALPKGYGPRTAYPLPLVISPHGRGLSARANLRLFGQLPARGNFAVVSPAGTGRKLERYSWGSPGQVDDLARMPEILRRTLPWLQVDRERIYAFGGSMGGQEVLLLLARHHRMLAGVAAFDAVTDFALQYRSFVDIPCGRRCRKTWKGPIGVSLRQLARHEVGGPPRKRTRAYALRSPITYARTIAASCVPLQLWWSTKDRIVRRQERQTGALYEAIVAVNPRAPVHMLVGAWKHSAEMHARSRLPGALGLFDLLPPAPRRLFGLRMEPAPEDACWRGGTFVP
jgi:pimeloyl-ACP methyl ester carboxylesterase